MSTPPSPVQRTGIQLRAPERAKRATATVSCNVQLGSAAHGRPSVSQSDSELRCAPPLFTASSGPAKDQASEAVQVAGPVRTIATAVAKALEAVTLDKTEFAFRKEVDAGAGGDRWVAMRKGLAGVYRRARWSI